MDHEPATERRTTSPLSAATLDLSKCERDHVRYYASTPSVHAVVLQRHAQSLLELAAQPSSIASPKVSASLDPVKRELWLIADESAGNGAWLQAAMESSWDEALSLVELDRLADMLGERHRIIANDWQAAQLDALAAKLLWRALDILGSVVFDPAEPRERTDEAASVSRLESAAALVERAAELLDESASFSDENERRWAVVQSRVRELESANSAPAEA